MDISKGWIKMRTSLKSHPKVNEIAALLEKPADGNVGFDVSVGGQRSALLTRNITRCVTVTSLLLVWSAANEHTSDGVFRNVDLSYLDVLAGFDGFGEAMAAVGWAIFDAENRCVILPKFCENNVPASQRGSTNAERQRRYRERQKANRNVTHNVTGSVTRNDDVQRYANIQRYGDTHSDVTLVSNASGVTKRDTMKPVSLHDRAISVRTCHIASPEPQERFAMHPEWQPSSDLIQIAAEAGMRLDKAPEPAQIAEFRAFWRSEGKQFRQAQWDLKLAQRLVDGHQYKVRKVPRRDVNAVPDMSYETPDGFRGN